MFLNLQQLENNINLSLHLNFTLYGCAMVWSHVQSYVLAIAERWKIPLQIQHALNIWHRRHLTKRLLLLSSNNINNLYKIIKFVKCDFFRNVQHYTEECITELQMIKLEVNSSVYMKQRIDCPYYDLLVLHTWPVLQAEESEF
jgi:hypothetical protein